MNQIVELEPIQTETNEVSQKALSIKVTSDQENNMATEFLKIVKEMKAKVSSTFRPHIQAAHKNWKDLIAEEKKHMQPLEEAYDMVAKESKTYFLAQEVKRRVSEQKLQEKSRKEEQDKKDDLERRAKSWEEKGNQAKADELRQDAGTHVAPVPIIPKTEAPQGTYTVKMWKFNILNVNEIPREFLMIDESKLKKYATAMKDSANVPGIQFYSMDDVRRR